MKTIQAVYEDGVFRPTEPVNLPEHCRVKVEPDPDAREMAAEAQIQREIYDIMGELYDSGDPYGAERHNEHQP